MLALLILLLWPGSAGGSPIPQEDLWRLWHGRIVRVRRR